MKIESLQDNVIIPVFYTDDDKNQWLIKNYAFEHNKYISDILGWNLSKVNRIAKKFNLSKNKETRSKISSVYGRTHFFNHNYFKHWTPDMAYILGFLTADGSIHKSSKTLKMSLKESDGYIIQYIKNELEGTQKIYYGKKTMNGKTFYNYSVGFSHRELYSSLQDIGFDNPKNYIKIYKSVPSSFKWNWLHGLFDGDGTCGIYSVKGRKTKSIHFGICNESYDLINLINIEMLRSLDTKIYSQKQKLFILNIGKYDLIKNIFNKIYIENPPKTYLYRKKIIMDKIINYISRND